MLIRQRLHELRQFFLFSLECVCTRLTHTLLGCANLLLRLGLKRSQRRLARVRDANLVLGIGTHVLALRVRRLDRLLHAVGIEWVVLLPRQPR